MSRYPAPILLACLALAPCAQAADDPIAALPKIRDAALHSDWAYERLTDLTDLIGARLAGSPGAQAAVQQLAAALRHEGISVTLDPVMVPHWVRGVERAELVGYKDRPAGISQRIVLTALGSSSATPEDGLTAQVLVIHDFEELARRASEVKGKIVLYTGAFDKDLAENGYAGPGYGQAGRYRFIGPAKAAALGASAVLVRSVGTADFRIPHTGATLFGDTTPIPAAAVTTEDALLIERLARRGEPVTMHLTLTPQTLPDVESANVIGEIPGSDPGAGVVVVSGHVDAWDLAQGATDDGVGVIAAMASLKILHDLHLEPRRTIRFIGWMNEENGSRGRLGYTKLHGEEFARHVAAIESDFGGGRPLGITTNVPKEGASAIQKMLTVLEPLGATVLQRVDGNLGSDLADMESKGVPVFEPLVDGRHYFDYHHTPADTLDKVDQDNLRRQVAVLAVLAYYLANLDPAPPRLATP